MVRYYIKSKLIICLLFIFTVFSICVVWSMTYDTVYAASCPGGGEHEYRITVIEKPTDTKAGREKYTCTKCGHSYEAVVSSTGHTYGQWKTVQEPTCIGEGIMERHCTTCNETENKIIPPTGRHNFGSWVTVRAASETQRGIEERTCSVCGSKETRIINTIAKPEEKTPDVPKKKAEPKEEAITTPTSTTMPEETPKQDPPGFNALDLILAIANILAAGSYYFLIRRDQYVINWDKERKALIGR